MGESQVMLVFKQSIHKFLLFKQLTYARDYAGVVSQYESDFHSLFCSGMKSLI